jgi:hypothetical protein
VENRPGTRHREGAFRKTKKLADVLRFVNSESELCRLLALKSGTTINPSVFEPLKLSAGTYSAFARTWKILSTTSS